MMKRKFSSWPAKHGLTMDAAWRCRLGANHGVETGLIPFVSHQEKGDQMGADSAMP